MSAHKSALRLFFAVKPDVHTLDVLTENAWHLGEGSHGRPVPRSNLHMTLIFLGEQPRENLPQIIAAADRVRSHGFDVVCDKLRYMNEQHLIWTGVSAPDPELGRLRDGLLKELDQAGIQFDRKRFKPHITLVRRALDAPNMIEFTPCRWSVDRFSLLISSTGSMGSRYHALREWSLLPARPRVTEQIVKHASTVSF